MSILEALLLGIVQGLTEFIPVSSSGHLVLLHDALGVNHTDLAFDVALHAGTLIALLIVFRKDVLRYARAILVRNKDTRLAWLLVAATLPAAVAGFLLKSAAEETFRSTTLVALNLLGFGLLMLVVEFIYRRQATHNTLDKTSNKQGIGIGFAQALALVPGVSRSGSTITAGMLFGLDRVAATRFSFLLGIPIIFGAALHTLLDPAVMSVIDGQLTIFAVGVVSALLSGLFAIKFMLKFLSGNGLELFAFYRIGLGAIVLAATFLT